MKTERSSKGLKSYCKPVLVSYGSLQELTTGGTGRTKETMKDVKRPKKTKQRP